MNKKKFMVMGLLLTVVLVLAACAPQTEAPPKTQEALPADEIPATEKVEPVPTEETALAETETMETEAPAEDALTAGVDVEALIATKVAGNHDLGRIFNADKTREEWEATLDRMIGYGAKINE